MFCTVHYFYFVSLDKKGELVSLHVSFSLFLDLKMNFTRTTMQRMLLPLWQKAHSFRLYSSTSLPCQKICVTVLSMGMKETCRQNSVLSFSSLSKSNPSLAFHQKFSGNIFCRGYFKLRSVSPGIFPRTVRSRLSACRSGLVCNKSTVASHWQKRNKTVMLYVTAGAVLVIGFSYAAVPLYTVFCQVSNLHFLHRGRQ